MIALLTILGLIFTIIEFFIVAIVTLLIIDMAAYYIKASRPVKQEKAAVKTKQSVQEMMAKERLRREKEASAHEGFFEESYVRGFDSNGALISRVVLTPTDEALAHYKAMDNLINTVKDAQIFDNTKEL